MTVMPLQCVVDASAGIKLFMVEALSDQAHALFAHLAADPPARLYVPDLFYIECTNILWKYTRRLGYPLDQAREDLADMGALALRSLPTTDLTTAALDIAAAQNITAYDACYVALARRLGVPLVTADQRLARVFAGSAYDVHWLGDFAIPRLPTA